MTLLYNRILKYNENLYAPMLPLKYEALAENPFRFFRGTCHLFYEDLAAASPLPLSPLAWICGDLHIENFGSYRGDNGLVYFDLNDFDEALLAPCSYEVVRMATSIFVAFEHLEVDPKRARHMARLYLQTYAATLCKGKAITIEPRTAKGIVCDFLKHAEKSREKELLKKRTVSKKRQIMLSLEDERHFKVDKKLRDELKAHIHEWVATSSDGPYNYKVLSAVFRLAGTGSIGVKRYLFLLKSTNTKNKYLLLDMKEARPSCVSSPAQQLQWTDEAQRVIAIQQRMQQVPAALLSTTKFRGTSYIIQELQPVKDSIKFKLLKDYRDMYQVINDMAVLTASAQLRCSGMQGSGTMDELMAFGADTTWQETVIEYARKYARQVTKNYKQYVKNYRMYGGMPEGQRL